MKTVDKVIIILSILCLLYGFKCVYKHNSESYKIQKKLEFTSDTQPEILDNFYFFPGKDLPGYDMGGYNNLNLDQVAYLAHQDQHCVSFRFGNAAWLKSKFVPKLAEVKSDIGHPTFGLYVKKLIFTKNLLSTLVFDRIEISGMSDLNYDEFLDMTHHEVSILALSDPKYVGWRGNRAYKSPVNFQPASGGVLITILPAKLSNEKILDLTVLVDVNSVD